MKVFVKITVILSVATLAYGQTCGSLKNLAGNDPSVDGALMGVYTDGSPIYAGTGDFSQCYNQNPAAARIQGNSAYSSCGWANGGELEDSSAAVKYFVNHPDLKWYPTIQANVESVPGAIKIGDKYLGRVNITRGSSTYQQVSKVDSWGMYYVVVGEGEKSNNIPVEILACIPCNNGGTGPFCCTNGANNKACSFEMQCGDLFDLANHDPAQLGLFSGNYANNVPIYPGEGSFPDCGQDPGIARIESASAHSSCGWADGGELSNPTNAKFFANHPDLKWYPTTLANVLEVPGAILRGNKMIGRVNVTNGGATYSQIAKVEDGWGMYYVAFGEGERFDYQWQDTPVDILACIKCTNGGTGPKCELPRTCGALWQLNGNDPSVDGFYAGDYADGAPVYPGIGSFPDCGQDPGIARITTWGNPGYGAHSACGWAPGGELHDSANASFYYNHPDLKWYPTTTTNAGSVPLAVKVEDKYIARINVTDGGKTYTQIGKVDAGWGVFYVVDGVGERFVQGDVEVLTCGPLPTSTTTTTSTTSTPTTTRTTTTTTSTPTTTTTTSTPSTTTTTSTPSTTTTTSTPTTTTTTSTPSTTTTTSTPTTTTTTSTPTTTTTTSTPTTTTTTSTPSTTTTTSTPSTTTTTSTPTTTTTTSTPSTTTTTSTPTTTTTTSTPTTTTTTSTPTTTTTTSTPTTTTTTSTPTTTTTTSTPTTTTTTSTPTTTTTTSTPTTTTTTRPTTQTISPIVSLQCGSFVWLNSTFQPQSPYTPGLPSGTYFDGSTVYPGAGNFAACANNPGSARITNTPGVRGPGAYQACGANELFDQSSARYIFNHPNLRWVETTNTAAQSVPGVIKVPVSNFLIGRIELMWFNLTVTQIGKVAGTTFYYWDPKLNTEQTARNFEVLACQECGNGGSGPYCCLNGANNKYCCTNGANNVDCCLNGGVGRYCCYNNATDPNCTPNYACGALISLSTFARPDFSQTPGLPSGVYFDNTTVYPGSGNMAACFGQNPSPSRISLSSPLGPGAWQSCAGTYMFDKNDPRFFFRHPNLRWIPTVASQAPTVPGLIYSSINFWVGKIKVDMLNTTYYNIGKGLGTTAGAGILYHWNVDTRIEVATTTAQIEVLACQACTNNGSGPYCCLNGANNRFCCENGADNPDCCLNGGRGQYCCINNATDANCTPNYQCGALIPYTRYVHPDYPQTPGLASGSYFDGSTIYPGTGNMAPCFGQNPSPARITTADESFYNQRGPGAYMSCIGTHNFDRFDAKFYYAHPNLRWVPTIASQAPGVPGIINPVFNFWVGRIRIELGNMTYYTIGKGTGVFAGTGIFWYWGVSQNIEQSTTTAMIEVLACQSCTNGGTGPFCCINGANNRFCCENGADNRDCCLNGGSGPYCCKNGANNTDCTLSLTNYQCGTLVNFNLTFNPTDQDNPGLLSGSFIDGSPVFPGTGNLANCGGQNPSPARIQVSDFKNGPGAYQSCGNIDNYDKVEPKFFLNHPNLRWVQTQAQNVLSVPGVIKVAPLQWPVGKIEIPYFNGTITTIGKVAGTVMYYFDPRTGTEKTISGAGVFDVLACQSCTNAGSGPYCCLNGANNRYCCENGANNPDCCTNGGRGQYCCTNNATDANCTPNYQCGQGLVLTESVYPDNPQTPGLPSGFGIDGEIFWPAYGNHDQCAGQNPSPARLALNFTIWRNARGIGTYQSCGNEIFDNRSPTFMYNHPNLRWVTTQSSAANNVPGIVRLGGAWNFGIGRLTFDTPNITYSVTGKIYAGNFYYYSPEKMTEIVYNGPVDVLACQTCTNGGSGPYCCLNGANNKFCCTNGANNVDCCVNGGTGPYCCINNATDVNCTPNYPCGALIPLSNHVHPDYPQTPGKVLGTFIDGSTIYAGVGAFPQCKGETQAPARISLGGDLATRGMGAYSSCTFITENFDRLDAYFFYDHPKLKWIGTDVQNAMNVPGVIKIGPGQLAVGRVDLTSPNGTWYQQSGKVWGANGVYFWEPYNTIESNYVGPVDVLACVP